MTEDGKSEREVKIRVALTEDAFNRHEKLITGNINKKLKKRLIKTLVWSVIIIWLWVMDIEEGRDQATWELWDVDMEEDGENKLEG